MRVKYKSYSVAVLLAVGALLAGCKNTPVQPAVSVPAVSSTPSVATQSTVVTQSTTSTPSAPVADVPDLAAAPLVPGTLPVDDPKSPMPAPNTCHLGSKNGQKVPDPKCTPGAINAAVTQDTIHSTICQSGWTSTVRPPASVTGRMKKLSAASYGITGLAGEYDHLVSLELGGAPDDPRNLWVEPGSIPNPKDHIENLMNRAICSGRITLREAQTRIASDWTSASQGLG